MFSCDISFLRILIVFFLSTNLLAATGDKVRINDLKKLFDNFHSVQSGALYRSAQLKPSRLRKYIQKFGIKSVINLRGVNEKTKWWQAEKATLEKLNVHYYNIPFSACHFSSKENLHKLLYLYKHAPKPILIHCRDGADRSGEAAALWVLEQQGKRKKDALKHLSIKYGYLRFRRPEKYFLISIWQGEKWLNQKYDPESYASKIKHS
ncbi:MAG: tyrosine-protein phosphatase [bacterium]